MRGFSAVVCVLLLMVFVQGSNGCCNVDTDSCSLNCTSIDTDTKLEGLQDCGNMFNIEIIGLDIPQNFTIQCLKTKRAILRTSDLSRSYNSSMCNVSQTNSNDLKFTCLDIPTSIPERDPFTTTTIVQTSSGTFSLSTSQDITSQDITSQSRSTSGNITLILLSIIIAIMALFMCVIFITLIIRRLRKRKRTHRINGRDLINQENIYQIVDGDRRPSRIIPIVTHGGECLEMTEFPRYNNIGNHHKLSNTSLSVSCEKGGFPTSQTVPMATAAYPNGYPPEHFYSIIPANKVSCNQKPYHSESYFPAPPNYPHGPQVHITHSSHLSLTDNIDPYSTLDEARNEAMVEIKSTHTEHSDDILMLNMFGSDKPIWTHNIRPLHLNVPSRNRNGRVSLQDDDENEYIHMMGDLKGGWGESPTQFHRCGFDKTDGLCQGNEGNEGIGRSDLSVKAQYSGPTCTYDPPEDKKRKVVETDEAPPTPDKSIEDLYAKVRKKTKRTDDEYSESSDDEVTFIIDNDECPPQGEYLAPPNLECANVTEKDRGTCYGQKYKQVHPVQPPVSGENTTNGERKGHIDAQQAGKMTKQANRDTHTL